MKQPVFSIQDILVGFHAPMVAANEMAMKRDFTEWCMNKSENQRADLRLFKIGDFDDQKGTIEAIDVPELILAGYEVGKE